MASNNALRMLDAGKRSTGRAPTSVAAAPPPAPASADDSAPAAQATRSLVAESYVKAGFFITPDQRSWLNKLAARAKLDGIDGISSSGVVRLALARLRSDVDDGLALTPELVAQAYEEAERFPGRKNRGLPARAPT